MQSLLAKNVFETSQKVAVLEAMSINGREERGEIKEVIECLRDEVRVLSNKLSRWESNFGAFFFIVGCIWTFLLATWKIILAKIGVMS